MRHLSLPLKVFRFASLPSLVKTATSVVYVQALQTRIYLEVKTVVTKILSLLKGLARRHKKLLKKLLKQL